MRRIQWEVIGSLALTFAAGCGVAYGLIRLAHTALQWWWVAR